jgi:hypothetical protein
VPRGKAGGESWSVKGRQRKRKVNVIERKGWDTRWDRRRRPRHRGIVVTLRTLTPSDLPISAISAQSLFQFSGFVPLSLPSEADEV